jgi:hypothetical protein
MTNTRGDVVVSATFTAILRAETIVAVFTFACVFIGKVALAFTAKVLK